MPFRSIMVAVFWTTAGVGMCQAAVVRFTDRTQFNSLFPGLPTETFEAIRLADGQVQEIDAPVNSMTNNAVLSLGDILDGLSVSSFPTGTNTMNALGPNVLTNTSRMVGNERLTPLDARLDIFFASGVRAAAMDVFAARTSGNSQAVTVDVTVFDTSGSQTGVLTSFDLDLAEETGGFLGLSSDIDIGRITLNTQGTPHAEFVDNISFGVVSIPEPSAGLLTLFAAGLLAWRRHPSMSTSGYGS